MDLTIQRKLQTIFLFFLNKRFFPKSWTKKSLSIHSIHSTPCVARAGKTCSCHEQFFLNTNDNSGSLHKHVPVFSIASIGSGHFHGYYLLLHHTVLFSCNETLCTRHTKLWHNRDDWWKRNEFTFWQLSLKKDFGDTKVGLFGSVWLKKQTYMCRSCSARLLS